MLEDEDKYIFISWVTTTINYLSQKYLIRLSKAGYMWILSRNKVRSLWGIGAP